MKAEIVCPNETDTVLKLTIETDAERYFIRRRFGCSLDGSGTVLQCALCLDGAFYQVEEIDIEPAIKGTNHAESKP